MVETVIMVFNRFFGLSFDRPLDPASISSTSGINPIPHSANNNGPYGKNKFETGPLKFCEAKFARVINKMNKQELKYILSDTV